MVRRPYKIRHVLAFQTGGCLLLHESSAESSCISALLSFNNKALFFFNTWFTDFISKY